MCILNFFQLITMNILKHLDATRFNEMSTCMIMYFQMNLVMYAYSTKMCIILFYYITVFILGALAVLMAVLIAYLYQQDQKR